jgi:hypothetical protein
MNNGFAVANQPPPFMQAQQSFQRKIKKKFLTGAQLTNANRKQI